MVHALPSAGMPGQVAGLASWAGAHVGDIVLESDGVARTIAAYVPRDTSGVQFVSTLASEALPVARTRAGISHVAQASLLDARTGAWHVSSLVDANGSPIRFDVTGAIRQDWDAARFEVRHVDVGSVHGESVEFPVHHAIWEATYASAPAKLGLPAVHTEAAKAALKAASAGTTTNAAQLLGISAARASERGAKLEPLRTVPAALADRPIATGSLGYDDVRYETFLDSQQAVSIPGDLDLAQRMARRLSIAREGQAVGVFSDGADSWIAGPLTRRARADDGVAGWGPTAPLHDFSPISMATSAPELEMIVRPTFTVARDTTGFTHWFSKVDSIPEAVTLRRHLQELPEHAQVQALEQRVAQLDDELKHASWIRRGSVTKAKDQAVSELAAARSARDSAVQEIIGPAGRSLLGETEEWMARGLPYRLRDLEQVPEGMDLHQAVNAARRASASSASTGTVVLEGLDGTLWRGTIDVGPDQVMEARFSDSVRAATVGGRTFQWDAAGALSGA